MIIQLLDIAPWPRETERVVPSTIDNKQFKVVDEKEAKKMEKEAAKAQKKAEKAKRKAEKKAEKARKKAEKQAKKNAKNLSATTKGTVTTVSDPSAPAAEATYAAMPTGVVIAVCASLLICIGSAWLYRRRSVKSEA